MKKFELISDFTPTGDQPDAIKQLLEGIERGDMYQTLLGVTGSGKTFTIANVVANLNRPTLVLSHNKTLAAQLYTEFKQLFPNNAVEYFVSYYDYYQPEAYLPVSDTYIEKDLSINDEIEKFRLSTTSSLLSGRRDVIVVASVSCIYGIGNPQDFVAHVIELEKGKKHAVKSVVNALVEALYSRNDAELLRGTFRLKGDTLDVYPAYSDTTYRIIFWDNEIESIASFDSVNGKTIENLDSLRIFPANIFMTTRDKLSSALNEIYVDIGGQIDFLKSLNKNAEAKRLEDRVNYDLEMMKELGYCSGIENYSRYFDGRKPGSRPYCLIDYFPDDFLLVVDESHVTIPQVRGMYGGDRSRKQILVDYGFRLPSAMDNRPLKFDEFEALLNQVIFVSATPADFELIKTEGAIVEQVIRPTGIPDPEVIVRRSIKQVDDLLNEIKIRIEKDERTLVTTLTKRMAEELTKYLFELSIPAKYIHSDVDTLERIDILQELRRGEIKVVVGVNLLREGLDLPEVTLVAILDADKEGFLRNERSLIQTAGRAARNINSQVILYAEKVTNSMEKMMEETKRRRNKQLEYNRLNGITPTTVIKSMDSGFEGMKRHGSRFYTGPEENNIAADPLVPYMSKEALQKRIESVKKEMTKSAKELDFISAAHYRDEMIHLQKLLNENI
ncbi:MAG: excinuclease ABC subunit B [Bacteroidetes bacterium HGW-Bacteroidetes-6]|jgi:excinuclease ABC subunit B|nr:MAG: excinuclease ABC subunit B [Bacteroidetes bacterium HGW-Bacteroidetes-6]